VRQRRTINAHPAVPEVKLVQQLRIELEEVERDGVRQPDHLHVAHQQEQIVQLDRLALQVPLIAQGEHAAARIEDIAAQLGPAHGSILDQASRETAAGDQNRKLRAAATTIASVSTAIANSP